MERHPKWSDHRCECGRLCVYDEQRHTCCHCKRSHNVTSSLPAADRRDDLVRPIFQEEATLQATLGELYCLAPTEKTIGWTAVSWGWQGDPIYRDALCISYFNPMSEFGTEFYIVNPDGWDVTREVVKQQDPWYQREAA